MRKIKIQNVCLNYTEKFDPNKDELLTRYWYFHPRFRFVKSLKRKSNLLDLGAGSGGLSIMKEWKDPKRKDIKMFALDLNKGTYFDNYEKYQIRNLDKEAIGFGIKKFDGVVMSHLLEHLADPRAILNQLYKRMAKGGKIYIEIPSPATLKLPPRQLFLDKKINTSTVNFFDDGSHIKTFTKEEVCKFSEETGFRLTETGIIGNDYLAPELLAYGLKNNDEELTTYGIWAQTGWAQYFILTKD